MCRLENSGIFCKIFSTVRKFPYFRYEEWKNPGWEQRGENLILARISAVDCMFGDYLQAHFDKGGIGSNVEDESFLVSQKKTKGAMVFNVLYGIQIISFN